MDAREHVAEIAGSVYWVGVKDWDRRMFDALIPLPQGTSYNAYVVKGGKATALIDTVNPGFWGRLEDKIDEVTDASRLDYLVMNHAEPDHASAVARVLERSPGAMLVATEKGASMAQVLFGVPRERVLVAGDGDAIDLGGKTLRFIHAPWLHWPETMFTYLPEDKILFPCDYFGAHTAFGFYDDEVTDLLPLAQRYFGEIMMPYRKPGAQALEKIRGLDIGTIAPGHGPIYRNPDRILEPYRRWTAGETREKAAIAYVSMWGSTDRMAKAMAESLMDEGIEVAVFNLAGTDVGDLARELVDSRAIVLGSPTLAGGMHPLAVFAAYLVKILRPPAKYAAFLGSYGWGGGALRQAQELLGPARMEIVGAVDVHGAPAAEDMDRVASLGWQLAGRIKGASRTQTPPAAASAGQ
jgi:flavorubredoxin